MCLFSRTLRRNPPLPFLSLYTTRICPPKEGSMTLITKILDPTQQRGDAPSLSTVLTQALNALCSVPCVLAILYIFLVDSRWTIIFLFCLFCFSVKVFPAFHITSTAHLECVAHARLFSTNIAPSPLPLPSTFPPCVPSFTYTSVLLSCISPSS